jgi:hypothetical protein
MPLNVIAGVLVNYRWFKYTLNMTIPIVQTIGDSQEIRDVVGIIVHQTGGSPRTLRSRIDEKKGMLRPACFLAELFFIDFSYDRQGQGI